MYSMEMEMNTEPLQLILGNESSDLDSACTSIALGLALSNAVPILNIFCEELSLRKDILFVLEQISFKPSQLFFRDTLPFFLSLAKKKKAKMMLVDHNALAPDQQEWTPYVNRIIDHHLDEHFHYPLLEEKIVKVTGSCATLVAEFLLERSIINQKLAILLLAPILIDTSNAQDAKKTTFNDLAVIEKLKKYSGIEKDPFYYALLENKGDITGLSGLQILNRDFKSYQKAPWTYGISSLPKDLEWTLENSFLWEKSIEVFFRHKDLDFLMVLGWVNGNKMVILYSEDPLIYQKILSNTTLMTLFIHPIGNSNKNWHFLYLKEPLPRKVFQPIFHAAIP